VVVAVVFDVDECVVCGVIYGGGVAGAVVGSVYGVDVNDVVVDRGVLLC